MKQARPTVQAITLLVLLFMVAEVFGGASSSAVDERDYLEIKMASYNILYWKYWKATEEEGRGSNAWKYRRGMVLDVIENFDADVIGLQESMFPQVEYLRAKLEDGYGIVADYVGGRHRDGLGNSIFYRKDRFEVGKWGRFWFSDTPEVPASMTWGNTHPRFCVWAYLVEKESGKGFFVYNVHFDHASHNAMRRSAVLLSERIAQREPKAPFVLVGDFNVLEDDEVIHFMKGEEPLSIDGKLFKNPQPLVDTFRVKRGEEADGATFHAFFSREPIKIDFVFSEKSTEVMDAEIIRYNEDGRYPSDHFPITATIRFR